MKISAVQADNRRKAFRVRTGGKTLWYPYAVCGIKPSPRDRITDVFVDPEIAKEGFTYILASGREGTVHIEQVLEYHRDPDHLREIWLYRLTLEAQTRLASCPLSKREIIRQLATSPAQFYRLIDPANRRKTVDRMLALLSVLDCELDFVITDRPARRAAANS